MKDLVYLMPHSNLVPTDKQHKVEQQLPTEMVMQFLKFAISNFVKRLDPPRDRHQRHYEH